jgi:hypothetical protein
VDDIATSDPSTDDARTTRGEDVAAFHGCMDTFDTLPLVIAPLLGLLVLLVVTVANLA